MPLQSLVLLQSFGFVYVPASHPLLCSFFVNFVHLSFVNRFSHCNNISQHEEEEELNQEPEELGAAGSDGDKKPEDGDQPTSSATAAEEATVAQKLEEAIMTNILPKLIHPSAETSDAENTDKLSCHDSGIDIRDPAVLQLMPQLQVNRLPQAPPKKYSDADIVLSDDWVPPVPLVTPLGGSHSGHLSAGYDPQGSDRKKTSSVSFSVEESEPQSAVSDKSGAEKKNKVIAR